MGVSLTGGAPVMPQPDAVSGFSINRTNLSAAIAATALFSAPSNTPFGQPIPFGELSTASSLLWQVVWTAVITTAATTSCVLGGATGFQLTWTDNDNPASPITPAAIPLITSSVNAAGTQINGNFIINPVMGSLVSYLFGYTSVGATAMVYTLRIRVMAVGI